MSRLRMAVLGATLVLFTGLVGVAAASEELPPLPDVSIPTDAETIELGERIVMARCRTCHSLQYLRDEETLQPLLSGITPDAAKKQFGVVPPDLSLIAIARQGGAVHAYAFLTGYENDLGDCEKAANRFISGGCTAMVDPRLSDEDALAVAAFLKEAADPNEKIRVRVAIGVEIFLGILTVMSYLVYRRIKKRELG